MTAPGGAGGRLRCEAHDLACDAQGRCVLCRRAAGLASEPPSVAPRPQVQSGRPLAWALFGGIVGVAAAGVALAFVLGEPPPAAPVATAAAATPASRPEVPSAEERARQAREAERARAEQMLREAESQRQELERRAVLEALGEPRIPTDPGALRDPSSRPPSTSAVDPALDQRVSELRQAREQDQRARAVARARERVQIIMYSAQWCGVCTRARNYMRAQGIPFTERDVDESASAQAVFRRLNPKRTLPTLDIDGHVMVGFSPSGLERALDHAALARAR